MSLQYPLASQQLDESVCGVFVPLPAPLSCPLQLAPLLLRRRKRLAANVGVGRLMMLLVTLIELCVFSGWSLSFRFFCGGESPAEQCRSAAPSSPLADDLSNLCQTNNQPSIGNNGIRSHAYHRGAICSFYDSLSSFYLLSPVYFFLFSFLSFSLLVAICPLKAIQNENAKQALPGKEQEREKHPSVGICENMKSGESVHVAHLCLAFHTTANRRHSVCFLRDQGNLKLG